MSVIMDGFNEQLGDLHRFGDETCFYCHNPIGAQAVWWVGATGDIYLHTGCAIDLMIGISRDLFEIRSKTRTWVTL